VRQRRGRLICDEVVAQSEMDGAIERVVGRLTGSGVGERRVEPPRLPRGAGAAGSVSQLTCDYALDQAYCHFSPALIANLEQNWNAKNGSWLKTMRLIPVLLVRSLSPRARSARPTRRSRCASSRLSTGQATDILARLLARTSRSRSASLSSSRTARRRRRLGTEAAAKARPTATPWRWGPSVPGDQPGALLEARLRPGARFRAISNLGLTPRRWCERSSELKTLKDLSSTRKKAPLDYASSGNGSASHLAMEMFPTASACSSATCPSREARTPDAGLAGRVPIMFDAIPGVAAQIKAGKLRALGIASPERSPFLSGRADDRRAGLSGFAAIGWIGIVAPARTPEASSTGSTRRRGASSSVRGQGAPH